MNHVSRETPGQTWFERIFRFAAAVALTGLLLVFLIVTRWIEPKHDVLTLRSVTGIDPVALPAPPPPPPPSTSQPTPPPPPAAEMELPKLDLTVDELALPIEAALAENQLDIMMKPAEFSSDQPAIKDRSLYSASELDTQPRLLNRPNVVYPASQTNQGVNEGKVTLEILINVAGMVTVRNVISNSHPDFIPMAKAFAAQARFSPPKKDGRIVNAVFNWPLVLRP